MNWIRKSYWLFFFSTIMLCLTSCTHLLYPIKDRLKPMKEEQKQALTLGLEQQGFYQLRIREMYSFKDSYTYAKNLNVRDVKKSSGDYQLRYDIVRQEEAASTEDSSQVLIQGDYGNEFDDFSFERISQDAGSDYPFRKFQQIAHMQHEEDSLSNIVEETYLYLDDFVNVDEEVTEPQSGLAFYFITYPMIDQEKRVEFFSDVDQFYSNTIRKVNVGVWMRWKNAVVLYLSRHHNKSEFFVLLGQVSEGRLSFTGISHPEIMRKGYFDNRLLMRRFLPELQEAERKLLKGEVNNSDNLKAIMNQTINNSAFVRLDRTFDLAPSSALLFSQMPPSKHFVHRTRATRKKQAVDEQISSILLGDFKLYMKTSQPDTLTYRFKKSQVSFLSE